MAGMVSETKQTAADPTSRSALLDGIDERVLWLASRMIHEANVVRPSPDGIKVGGHQASSASSVSILTELYGRWLRPGDIIAPKPHAAPVVHAIHALMGILPPEELARLRSFGGLQSYLSRTKDPVPADMSLGSMGLGPAAPLFLALSDRYLRDHLESARNAPTRRFVALVGDAELDEGNIWEAIADEALHGLGSVTWIIDLNRQSLDRVIPGIRVRQLESAFMAAGWQVLEAKYGRRLLDRFEAPGGGCPARSHRPDDQRGIPGRHPHRRHRAACEPHRWRRGGRSTIELAKPWLISTTTSCRRLLAGLGGHDHDELARMLAEADAAVDRPSVLFAYTIKGWRLPFAGDALNHSALMKSDQVEALAQRAGRRPRATRGPCSTPDSAAGELMARRGEELYGKDSGRGSDLKRRAP